MSHRRGYDTGRIANGIPPGSDYLFAQVDLSSKNGDFYSWQEALPTSNSAGLVTFTVLPKGRSGNSGKTGAVKEPGILLAGITLSPTQNPFWTLLLKTTFYQTGQSGWIIVYALGAS